MAQMNISAKQKQIHRHREQTCVCRGGEERGGDWEFGVSRRKLLHLEGLSNGVLPYSTGNYIQYLGTDHDGRKYRKRNGHICVTGSLRCVVEINTL